MSTDTVVAEMKKRYESLSHHRVVVTPAPLTENVRGARFIFFTDPATPNNSVVKRPIILTHPNNGLLDLQTFLDTPAKPDTTISNGHTSSCSNPNAAGQI